MPIEIGHICILTMHNFPKYNPPLSGGWSICGDHGGDGHRLMTHKHIKTVQIATFGETSKKKF